MRLENGNSMYVRLVPRTEHVLTLKDWNWHLDSSSAGGNLLTSPLLDPVSGFGGNGAKINFTMGGNGPRFGGNGPRPNTPKGGKGDEASTEKTGKGERPDPPRGGKGKGFDAEGALLFFGTGGGCVQDGPLKDMKLHIGPFGKMAPNNVRCLTRSLNPRVVEMTAQKSQFATILSAKNFGDFMYRVSGVPPDLHTLG
jgi:hypothetical protein